MRLLIVLGLLYLFLVAVGLMGDSIKAMGKGVAGEDLFAGIANPFAALAVGVLATVLVQSSSTTTATIVGLVGQSGPSALPLATAVPMIMGANIGTTVTNTLVSIGHVRQGAEFRRAFAAATVHDFFNLLCVAALLPLELLTGFLQRAAVATTGLLAGRSSGVEYHSPIKSAVKAGSSLVGDTFAWIGFEGRTLAILTLAAGIALVFFCLALITRNMRALISDRLESALNDALGRSGLIGVAIGALITVSVQSSSITTSLLVPMCAAGVLKLNNAFPIMIGANIGTTVTGLLASLAADTSAGLSIALVHLYFNLAGMLLFFPVPFLRAVPIRCAEVLAARAQKNVLWVVGYVVVVFVVLPLAGYLLFPSGGS